jgi:S1-C subfamily serine protease
VTLQENKGGEGVCGPATGDHEEPGRPRRAGWVRRTALAGAAVIAAAAGFGLASLAAGPGGQKPVSSAIPSPATGSSAFTEDDNLTGQDNQDNILQATARGMVHIMSGRSPAGTGIVLTPSGKVLTTYQPAPGARGLAAKYVLSGATFTARVIGEGDGLALLQMEGGDGRAFSTVTVGNSATLVDGSYNSKEVSYHIAGEVLDTAVGTIGTSRNVTIDLGTLVNLDATVSASGHTQGGLMKSVLQSGPAAELGGPLVDLNGRVVGITVAEARSGLNTDGYAIPINTALATAARIDARAHDSRGS